MKPFCFTLLPSLALGLAIGCSQSKVEEEITATKNASDLSPTEFDSQTRSQIEKFCGDCHAVPLPSTFPKSSWPEEVKQGFAFYIESQRTDLVEPNRADVVRFFQASAPEKVIVPRADKFPPRASPVQFESKEIRSPRQSFATAHLNWTETTRTLAITDMHSGTLYQWRPDSEGLKPIASGKHFCRATQCDWNADGELDFLLGEMGTFPVGDHTEGRVSLLLANGTGYQEPIVLADNLSRCVEAVPIDYDVDGDLDVIVADFGWRNTGALRLLRNSSTIASEPTFATETIDDRHGALGVQLADMNQDGRMDFVVSYGQEFESVEIYFNRSPSVFERQLIFQFPDPSYNASSLRIVDMDNDGCLDIVHTCGDTMDALIPKPYHGVHLLRNMGNESFKDQDLGLLVGALQATVADFDNDGDLDIAAVGLFPDAHRDPGAYDSICWWEQTGSLEFVRHSIERDRCNHASCTVGDVDQDGRVDLIVGDWLLSDSVGFKVFYNRPSQ